MRADQPTVQETQIVEIFGGKAAALRPHRGHFAPDLVQMDGGDGFELLLQSAHIAQKLGRAHVWRPGGDADAYASFGRTVALAVQRLDARKAPLAELAVDLERRRIADRAPSLVPGALG